MEFNLEVVNKLAQLARLELTSAESEEYAVQLAEVLQYVEQLQAVDTTQVEETSQVTGLTNVWRSDKSVVKESPAECLSSVPKIGPEGGVLVPNILDNN